MSSIDSIVGIILLALLCIGGYLLFSVLLSSILALGLFALLALGLIFVVWLTTLLGVYSLFVPVVLLILIIHTFRSMSGSSIRDIRQFRKDTMGNPWAHEIERMLEDYHPLRNLMLSMLIFVIGSVFLIYAQWLMWIFAIITVILVISLNLKFEEEEPIMKVAREMTEISRQITGNTAPRQDLDTTVSKGDWNRNIFGASLAALFIYTTLVIYPLSLPIYTPLTIWGVSLATAIAYYFRENIKDIITHFRR